MANIHTALTKYVLLAKLSSGLVCVYLCVYIR